MSAVELSAVPENPQQTKPPLSNEQILAQFAHRLLNQERNRLLQEAEKYRAKNPEHAERIKQRAGAFKAAMNFFKYLQKKAGESIGTTAGPE